MEPCALEIIGAICGHAAKEREEEMF